MTPVRIIYITCQGRDQALTIGRSLVERGLAACVNIIPGMVSLYRWQGRIVQGEEAVLIVKTLADGIEGVMAAVRSLHGDEVPCQLVLAVEDGDQAYLDWIMSEVRSRSPG